jgi:hypothetical protein
MRIQAADQLVVRVSSTSGQSAGWLLLHRPSNDDGTERDIMGKPAGGTGKGQLIGARDTPDRNAQRMRRPTLLEKRAAMKDMPHRRPALHNFHRTNMSTAPIT